MVFLLQMVKDACILLQGFRLPGSNGFFRLCAALTGCTSFNNKKGQEYLDSLTSLSDLLGPVVKGKKRILVNTISIALYINLRKKQISVKPKPVQCELGASPAFPSSANTAEKGSNRAISLTVQKCMPFYPRASSGAAPFPDPVFHPGPAHHH